MSSFRKNFIGGNWKCNCTPEKVTEIIERLNGATIPSSAEVVVATPAIYLSHCKANLKSEISVSSQDVAVLSGFGAYTGEMTAAMLTACGINWTIVGHSERRCGFKAPGESDELVGQKTKAGIDGGMKVIACIGEDLAEREAGVTNDVCGRQLAAISACLTEADWANVVIAYEPKWAIGTGKVATPEQAESAHQACRQWIAANVSENVSQAIRIIYGGSVNATNCGVLIQCANIDGFLVGGASLKADFTTIIECA